MKTALAILAAIALAITLGIFVTRTPAKFTSVPPTGDLAMETTEQPGPSVQTASSEPVRPFRSAAAHDTTTPSERSTATLAAAQPAPSKVILDQALDLLLSGSGDFQQRQAAWARLREGGKLDAAIVELEQRMAANPNAAQYPATLGQAYLQKAGTLQDVREQGILGMKADQSFEAALNMDSSNWDARFWKASAMSYWPPQLGKGKEVIQQFLDLLKQQELSPPEPQFVQTYLLLGEQYQKQGQASDASEIWKRGLSLYPKDPTLIEKITSAGGN